MAMMRYNIQCEKGTLKVETCMFSGSSVDICTMLSYLVDHIYSSVIKQHGCKGLKQIHILTQSTLQTVYDTVVRDYLEGGQDDNRDLQE